MNLPSQLEHGSLRSFVKRKAGNKNHYKKPMHRLWRRWGKNRDNDEEPPMYRRYKGYEL